MICVFVVVFGVITAYNEIVSFFSKKTKYECIEEHTTKTSHGFRYEYVFKCIFNKKGFEHYNPLDVDDKGVMYE